MLSHNVNPSSMKIFRSNLRQNRLKRPVMGFTLIEMLVAVAIMGILAAIAGPSLSRFIQQYRVNAVRDEITASLQLARVTAMSQQLSVFLVKNPVCTGVTFTGTNDWSCGWRIIADTNRNGNVNSTTAPTGDTLIQTTTVPAGITVVYNENAGGTTATLTQWGQFSGVGARNFRVTSAPYGVNDPTSITCISSGGRIVHIKDMLNCPP
jgi:type IV fimbrial biogenesis protein FimT